MNAKLERIARFALAAATVVALVSMGATSGAAQKKGKGKKGGDDPSDIPLIITFRSLGSLADPPTLDFVRGDDEGENTYIDSNLQQDQGWAHIVRNGNFTLKTAGGGKNISNPRTLLLDLRDPDCGTWPDRFTEVPEPEGDGFGRVCLTDPDLPDDEKPILPPTEEIGRASMSINGVLDDPDHVGEPLPGGPRDMLFEGGTFYWTADPPFFGSTNPQVIPNTIPGVVGINIARPEKFLSWKLSCGFIAHREDQPDDTFGTDFVNISCIDGTAGTDKCDTWVVWATGASGSDAGDLTCRLWDANSKGETGGPIPVADFNVPFRLLVQIE